MPGTFQRFKIEPSKTVKAESKVTRQVTELPLPKEPNVSEFLLKKVQEEGEGTYGFTREKFGPLAKTDPDRKIRSTKDSKFELTSLAKDPLAIAEEEARVVNAMVEDRIAKVIGDAEAKAMAVGFEAGEKKGYQEAFKKFQSESQSQIAHFTALLEQMELAKTELFKANEKFLIELIFRISKMVLLREIQTDRKYLSRLVTEVLDKIGTRENIRLRINPMDLISLSTLKEDIETKIGALKNLNVEASQSVKQGGCIIETEFNAIDASIETQLNLLFDSIVGSG